MSEKKTEQKRVRSTKTRYYYTDYVNHMVRFYLTCPEMLKTDGKRKCDIENWIVVQGVLHGLPEEDRKKVIDIYTTHFNLQKAVDMYCEKTGAERRQVWLLLARVAAIIAKRRGLV